MLETRTVDRASTLLRPAARSASEDPALTDGHQLARGAVTNAFVLLAANFRGIFTFLIARLLGEAALGRFGLAFAATELLSKPGVLGFDSSMTPMVARQAAKGDGEACRQLFRRAITWAGAASLVLALGAIAFVTWSPLTRGLDAFSHGSALMLLALPGIAIARISGAASRGVLSMGNDFYSRGLTETWVTTGVFVFAVSLGIRDSAPALAVVAGTSAAALVAFALASRTLARVQGSRIAPPHDTITPSSRDSVVPSSPDPIANLHGTALPSAGAMLRFSLPMAGSNLLNVLIMEADVLMLGAYVGRAPGVTPETFGVFCAAAQLAVGLRKVRQIFDPILAPVVATRAVSAHRAALKDTVAGPGRWVLSAQLPLVGAVLLSSGAILSIYGPGFRQGALWLALLGLAHGANTFAGLVETLLMIERPGLNLINAAVTLGVQGVAGILLIPQFGVTGAAVAMCLGFATQGILRFGELRLVYGWSWPWRSLSRPLTAFAIAFAPAAVIRLSGGHAMEIVAGVMFLLLYVGAWRLLGAEPADREIWKLLRPPS